VHIVCHYAVKAKANEHITNYKAIDI